MGDKAVKEYKKLSAARYWARGAKLWMGKDHLLFCDSLGYTEDYKRFYFRDIQAFLLRPAPRRLFWGLVWGFFLALIAILILTLHETHNWFLWSCEGFFLSIFSINLFLGPGCYCHLKTAVQTIELPVKRMKKAEKIIARLKPLVEAAQASLPGGPAPVPATPERRTPDAGETAVPGTQKKPFRPGAHWALFTVLFLNALASFGRFFSLDFTLFVVGAMLSFGSVVPLIFALVSQAKSDVSNSLRRVTWGVIVFVIVEYFLSLAWGMVLSIQHPRVAQNQWDLLKLSASIGPNSSMFDAILTTFDVAGCLIFCVIGVAELARHHRRAAAGPSAS